LTRVWNEDGANVSLVATVKLQARLLTRHDITLCM